MTFDGNKEMIGKTLSHYKILEKLGEGGMGVVYKAEDTQLKREVAIKFLPPHIARHDEERKRFRLEAQAAASLNHNNIATIHNIEEVDDETFIVMEFIKGQELKDRIESGPLPIDEALDVALQIAKGLQAAHGNDIIHRDIKSANIMLTEAGDVKVMDFGLAKLGSKTKLTQEGTTLGTVAYMSPEQTRGEDVDQRSDLFSFGALLYEMLTGQLPFRGDYDQAVTYSILNEDPEPLTGLRTGVPMELERIVNKCLEKEAGGRYPSAADLIVDLTKVQKERQRGAVPVAAASGTIPPATGKGRRPLVLAGMILGSLVIVTAVLILTKVLQEDAVPRLTRPTQVTSVTGVEDYPTWSPEGGRIAYVQSTDSGVDIMVTQVAGGQPVNLTGDHDGWDLFPSWSPDGHQIAFWSDRDGGGYFVVSALGGHPRKLASSQSLYNAAPQWSTDGSRLAYILNEDSGSSSVEIRSMTDGTTEKFTLPGQETFRLDLSWSKDRRFFAYVDAVDITAEVNQTWVLDTSTGKGIPVTDGLTCDWSPTWSADGRSLFIVSNRGGSMDLWQQPLSKAGAPDGPPRSVTTGVGMLKAVFSPDGSKLAYAKGRRVANIWRVPILADRAANWDDAKQLTFDQAFIEFIDVTPDGEQLAFSSDRSGNQDVWLLSTRTGDLRQITNDPTPEWEPVLSPDGQEIVYYGYRTGNRDIWIVPIDGGPARQLTNHPGTDYHPDWSPDGKEIVFASVQSGIPNIWMVSAHGGEPRQFTDLDVNTNFPRWSKDGESIIFSSVPDYRLMRQRVSGGLATYITQNDAFVPRLSVNGELVYFLGIGRRANGIWVVSYHGGQEHAITDLRGRPGNPGLGLAASENHIYFTWGEEVGDIWVMDVANEK